MDRKDIFQEYVEEGCKTKDQFIRFFLDDDMRQTCDTSLPQDIDKFSGKLKGTFILQVYSIKYIQMA